MCVVQSLHLSVYRDLSAPLDRFRSWLELGKTGDLGTLFSSAHVFRQNNPLNEFMFPDPALPFLTAETLLGTGPGRVPAGPFSTDFISCTTQGGCCMQSSNPRMATG